MGIKRWKLPEPGNGQIERLMSETSLPWLVCAVLTSRGIRDAGEAEAFLTGGGLSSPFELADMDKAAARVTQAIEDGERIAVYGDYDCDGITATALLTSYLQSVGADVIYYVPSREKEGYGLNKPAIKMLKGQKTDLIVTVDNGVSALDEVEYANSLGIDVVITDHHTPRDTLPAAVAVVNPHRRDCNSPYKELAGVGVAFKLVCALENAYPDELLEYYSDLVALGTIADVVPLTGENRVIVKHGLGRIRETERPGIRALIEVSGLSERELSSEAVAFGIIPRINAAGRMGVADDVIELLLTDDTGYSEEISELVNGQNAERKLAEDVIIREIDGILKNNREVLQKRLIIISGKDWHHGVVGIVASKIVEKYGKPCILISSSGGVSRGSGRSVEGFSLIEAITACKTHLTQFGGHRLAAGLTLPTSELEAFGEAIQRFALEKYPVMPVSSCNIDCVLPPGRLVPEEFAELSRLEPFGAANETPLFLLKGVTIDGIYPTADQKHLRIRFSVGGTLFYAVYFRMTQTGFPFKAGSVVDVVAGIANSEYNGKSQLSIKIRDLRPSNIKSEVMIEEKSLFESFLRGEALSRAELETLTPARSDVAAVYKALKKSPYADAESLYYAIFEGGSSYGKTLAALEILRELNLITPDSDTLISPLPDPPKVSIDDAPILSSLKAKAQVT